MPDPAIISKKTFFGFERRRIGEGKKLKKSQKAITRARARTKARRPPAKPTEKRRTNLLAEIQNGIFSVSILYVSPGWFVDLAAAAADVALVARGEIVGGFCHLSEALVETEEVCAELLGHVEALVLVLLSLRLDARVVFIRRHFALAVADCAGAGVRGGDRHGAGAADMSLCLAHFLRRRRHFHFRCLLHRVVVLFAQFHFSLGVLLLTVAAPQQVHLHRVEHVVEIEEVSVDEGIAQARR